MMPRVVLSTVVVPSEVLAAEVEPRVVVSAGVVV